MLRKWLPAEPTRCGLAIIAGLMLAFSFPHWSIAGFAWIAPGLMLASAMGSRGKDAFRLGVIAGLANWLVGIYWLLLIPVKFAPIVGWLALCAFLSLYTGLWVWLAWKTYPLAPNQELVFRDAPRWFYGSMAFQRVVWCFACAAFWVAIEMVQSRFLSGFPWNLLGTSQYKMLHLIQISSYTGVYGVSFLVVWFSVSLLCATIALIHHPTTRWNTLREIGLPAAVVVFTVVCGFSILRHAEDPPNTIKMALVQPSIPQTIIWDQREDATRFQQLLKVSRQALAEKPDILVWPEAAVPSQFRWDTNRYDGLTVRETMVRLAQQHKVWLLFGADDAEPTREKVNFYNSAFAISPEGEIIGTYRKRQLVMFGEYVPLSRVLPFLKDFTQVYGEFTPGKAPIPFHLDSLRITTSVLICFEDLFAHLGREYVTTNTDFLLNLTNNGWFGESAAQWQHAVGAIFRAIENGLPLVRCANNGLSCWIDGQGRMHEVYFPDGSKNIYRAGYKIAQVPILNGQSRAPTFYTTHGDIFGWACVAFTVVFPITGFVMRLARK
ncbi:MAG TPA: apolipoprotein N-acyltransferase [Verrucomicrobiae bacterium]|nr:apolipoprotein N-acyltransferase [Verrucomicrobiae bacterium]